MNCILLREFLVDMLITRIRTVWVT